MDPAPDYSRLQTTLGHQFADMGLLIEALRHSSFVNEQSDPALKANERLEYLGDAVLNLVVSHLLMRAYPSLREGDLSRIRANLVNEARLADIGRGFRLGEFIQLGKGEMQTAGQEKNSILADCLEAVIAAVYLDDGYDTAFRVIERHFLALIKGTLDMTIDQDYKSRLQETVQGKMREVPRYQVVEESGPDHDKTFCVVMTVGELQTRGTGKSKKLAEQDAARKALEKLDTHPCHRTPA